MTTEAEPTAPKTYDQTPRFWIIFLASMVAAILFSITVLFPYFDNVYSSDERRLETIAKTYGAQEVSWGHEGLMYVKKDGVLRSCHQLSDSEVADQKPIKCDDGVLLEAIER